MNFVKSIIAIAFLFIFPVFVSAQELPTWVENKGFSPWISERENLTGFGISVFSKNDNIQEAQKLAEENAKKNLAEKIRVHVHAETKTLKQQTGIDFEQKLESEVISITEIELLGLKKEFYVDKKNGMAYCLVQVPRAYLIKSYEYKIFEKNKELENAYFIAAEYEKNKQKNLALENYLNCSHLINIITDLQSILLGLGKIPEQTIVVDKVDVSMAVSRLVNTINSVNDLAFFVAYVFKEQTQNKILTGVIVSPLTYRNTGMASQFSKILRESIEHQLVVHNQWETYPIKKYDPTIENMSRIKYAVKGSYWESDEKININVFLNEILTGKKLASIEYAFDRKLADIEYLPLKPKNFDQAKSDMAVFKKDEFASNGIQLDVFTNKGQDDLIFTEGDKMKVFLKTNLPCYIQLIYHLSDSTRILFLNNEFLDIDKINKIYELPFVFVCRPPFGVETLQVNASAEPFPPMKTNKKDGMLYIEEDLENILKKSREFDVSIFRAEKRLVITTMPN